MQMTINRKRNKPEAGTENDKQKENEKEKENEQHTRKITRKKIER